MATTNEDRLAQLNALASGGTAGLKSYQSAQNEITQNRQAALDSLGSNPTAGTNYGGSISGAAKTALDSYINQNTQHNADAGAFGVQAATDQVGYNGTAMDSYMAQNQAKLAEQQREFAGGLQSSQALKQIAYQGQVDQLQAKQDALSAQGALGGLTAAEQQNVIQGAGGQLQAQAVDNITSAAQAAPDDRAQVTSGRARLSKEMEMDKQAQADNAAAAAGQIPKMIPNGRQPQAMEDYRQQQMGEAAQAARQQAAQQWQQALGGQNARVSMLDELLQTAPQMVRNAQVDLPQYERQAAGQLGMNPLLAAGMFPSDPATLNKNASALDAAQNYDETAGVAKAKLDQQATDAQYGPLAEAAGLPVTVLKTVQKGMGASMPDLAAAFSGQAWPQIQDKLSQYATAIDPATGMPDPNAYGLYMQEINANQGAWTPDEIRLADLLGRQQFGAVGYRTSVPPAGP